MAICTIAEVNILSSLRYADTLCKLRFWIMASVKFRLWSCFRTCQKCLTNYTYEDTIVSRAKLTVLGVINYEKNANEFYNGLMLEFDLLNLLVLSH